MAEFVRKFRSIGVGVLYVDLVYVKDVFSPPFFLLWREESEWKLNVFVSTCLKVKCDDKYDIITLFSIIPSTLNNKALL